MEKGRSQTGEAGAETGIESNREKIHLTYGKIEDEDDVEGRKNRN